GMTAYVELKARSAFSFGDGAVSPERLAERAAELGYGAMALVDSGDLGGIIRFALSAQARGLRPIAGAEIRVNGRPVGLLAQNETGYRNLAHLVTRARLENERGSPWLTPEVVAAHADGLFLLTGPPNAELATLLRERGEEVARE